MHPNSMRNPSKASRISLFFRMAREIAFDIHDHPLPDLPTNGSLIEQQAHVDMEYGSHDIQRWFFEGIRIDHVQHHFKDHFFFQRQNPKGLVSLGFNLRGTYDIHQAGQSFHVLPGQHNIVYPKGHGNTLENKSLEGESFSIMIQPEAFFKFAQDGNDTLKRFLDRMLKDEPAVMLPQSLFTTPELAQAIGAILNCPFSGSMKQMYLLSKSIEILVLQAEEMDKAARKQEESKLRAQDRMRLGEAKVYMETHFLEPPSLSELSRIVGINEYKLKRGFKELFGTTVFGHLSNFRMERAKSELRDTEKPIGEIASGLGYSSSQHFSRAFKEKFGSSPGQFRKGS